MTAEMPANLSALHLVEDNFRLHDGTPKHYLLIRDQAVTSGRPEDQHFVQYVAGRQSLRYGLRRYTRDDDGLALVLDTTPFTWLWLPCGDQFDRMRELRTGSRAPVRLFHSEPSLVRLDKSGKSPALECDEQQIGWSESYPLSMAVASSAAFFREGGGINLDNLEPFHVIRLLDLVEQGGRYICDPERPAMPGIDKPVPCYLVKNLADALEYYAMRKRKARNRLAMRELRDIGQLLLVSAQAVLVASGRVLSEPLREAVVMPV